MEILIRKKIISIGLTVVLLIGLVVGVVLVQRQQILKSRASLQLYNAFAVKSGDSEHYVNCSGNVCETNTLNITISVADLQALNIQDQQGTAAKTDEQCQSELGNPPPFCDLNTCIKNKPVVKDNQCRFDIETVDLALCPNNCQSNGTQTILCREVETCQKFSSGQLTGKLIKYWVNEIGGIEGCQAPQESDDVDKCPKDQTLATGQYTATGGGLTGQVNAGTAPIPFCSAQDFATPCWQGADCKEENQVYANRACSNNHGAGSKCTRSTGASNAYEDGCTQPESTEVADSCSGQYITACWQGADCKEENQASANVVCSQNHGSGSVCTRATGMGNVYEDGCTYGSSSQIAAGIKQACTSEAYATSCWIEARCDETNQRFADRTCVNSHGEGSACTRATGVANTNDDGCTKTVVDVAQERRARVAQSPACTDIEECDEKTATRKIYPCGQQPAIEVSDTSCSPDLKPEQAVDLYLESQRQAALIKKQEAEKQDKPFWEKAGDLAGGLWNGVLSLGKGAQEAPTQGEVGQANRQAIAKNFQSFLGESQRGVENFNQASPECQEAASRETVGLPVEKELLEKCFGSSFQGIDKKASVGESVALESGNAKAGLSQMGVNMDVGEAKIAKTGICINFTLDPNARCIGFTGESIVPADASQNLSEVMRKAEVVKLAEDLGLDLSLNPKDWDKAKREFFFHAVARTDLNAGKFAAEFFGIPITAWENADKAAKICARDHKYACFVDSSMPASSWIQSASNEQIDQLNKISQNYFRGFEPAPPELLRKYGYLVDVNVLNQTGKQFGKPLEISAEDWDNVLRTFRVYAQTGDNIKNNTAAGRLYQEKQTQAVVESYIGLVSTVVDPMPVAQALSSGLKYVVVKQVYKRLSERFGSKAASEMAEHVVNAAARGRITNAAEDAAVKAAAEAVGLPPVPNPTDQLAALVDNGVVEPPPAVKALVDARVDSELQQTAAQGLKNAHKASEADLGRKMSVISDGNFVELNVPMGNPVEAVQNKVNGFVDDVGRALNREAEPPVPHAGVDDAAPSYNNQVLAQAADVAEPDGAPMASHLNGVKERLIGETSTHNPALEIVDGAVNGAKDLADNAGQALGIAPKELPVINGDPGLGRVKVVEGQVIPFTFTDDASRTVSTEGKTYTIGGQYIEVHGNVLVPVRLEDGTVAMTYLSTSEGEFKWFAGIIGNNTWFIKSDKSKAIMSVPSQLDMTLKEALGDGQNGILKKLTAFVGDWREAPSEKARFIHLMDSLGLRHDLSQVGGAGNPVDNFLQAQGVREKDITTQAAREIAGNLDYGQPTNVVWNQYAKAVDVYYQGSDPVYGSHQIKFTFSLDPDRQGSYIGPVNFSLIPLDDPGAAYVPAYMRAEKGFQPTGQGVPAFVRSQYGPIVKVAEKEFDEIAERGLDSNVGRRLSELTDGFTKLPEKGDVERLMAELAGAPCPISSLIPIAYAQGLTPCPKNPVAAMWHNVQNTGRQVGDTVSGWVDNVLNKFKKKEEVSFWLESSEKYAQDAHFGQKLGSGVYSEVYDTGHGTAVKLFEHTSQTFEKKGLPDINLLQIEAMKTLTAQYPDSKIFPKFIREISAKDSKGRISLRGFEMEKIEGENLREFAEKGEFWIGIRLKGLWQNIRE